MSSNSNSLAGMLGGMLGSASGAIAPGPQSSQDSLTYLLQPGLAPSSEQQVSYSFTYGVYHNQVGIQPSNPLEGVPPPASTDPIVRLSFGIAEEGYREYQLKLRCAAEGTQESVAALRSCQGRLEALKSEMEFHFRRLQVLRRQAEEEIRMDYASRNEEEMK
jgi:hypothetical protein